MEYVVDSMKKQFPNFTLRLGCVGYRDWCDDKQFESQNFTESIASFKSFFNNLKAMGGGDAAEDVLGGLSCAADLNWNSKLRVLFHICDAPPHNKLYHDGVNDNYPDGHSSDPSNYHAVVLDKLRAKNIHLCIAKLNDSVTKMINVFQDYGKKIELSVEEKSVKDANQLLDAVKQTLVILTKMRKEIKQTEDKLNNITNALDTLSITTTTFNTETQKKNR